jgi:hypothetical protein
MIDCGVFINLILLVRCPSSLRGLRPVYVVISNTNEIRSPMARRRPSRIHRETDEEEVRACLHEAADLGLICGFVASCDSLASCGDAIPATAIVRMNDNDTPLSVERRTRTLGSTCVGHLFMSL